MSSVAVVQERVVAAKKPKPIYTFEFPKSVASDITSIGLYAISVQDELNATKRANGDQFRLAIELTLVALAEVNGQKVSLVDGSAERAFDDMGPQARQLLMAAYAKVNGVGQAETEVFLASQKVKVT